MLWNIFLWTGVLAWSALGLRLIYFLVQTVLVMRVGWTRLEELGFWRSLSLAATTGRPWHIY